MRGLYVITLSTITDPELMYRQVHEAIQGGAVLVQFRHKGADAARHKRLAESVLTACQQNRTPAIMNDSIQQAQALGFDGVHLGQTDGSIEAARQQLGPDAIIGRTCHDSYELMQEAVFAGASYCAFGRLFQSETKPDASGLSLDALAHLVSACKVPVVAIGGITLDNAPEVLAQGVDMLAVSGAVFQKDDVGQAASHFRSLF
jgi:thiamine-phosphate pyrophosphorylase